MNFILLIKTDYPYYKHAIVNKYFKKLKYVLINTFVGC